MRSPSLLIAATLTCVVLSGCPDGPSETTELIGTEGGRLEAPGLVLEVPPGALNEPLTITVKREPDAEVPARFERHSALYRFEPSGTVFQKPIKVRIDDGDPPDEAEIFWTNRSDPGHLEPVPTEREGDAFIAEVTHFSAGFVGGFTPGACVCSATDECCDGCKAIRNAESCGVSFDAGVGEFGYCAAGTCKTGGQVSTRPTEGWVQSVAIMHGGGLYAFMDSNQTIEVRRVSDDSVHHRFELGSEVAFNGVNHLAIDIADQYLAAAGCRTASVTMGCTSGFVMMWRLNDGVRVMDVTTPKYVAAVAVSQVRFVAAGGCASFDANGACLKGYVDLYDADTGNLLGTLPSLEGGRVATVAFSIEGKQIAAGGCASEVRGSGDPSHYCHKGRLNLWDRDTRALVRSFPGDSYQSGGLLPYFDIDSIAFLADGGGRTAFLAATSWEVESGTFGPSHLNYVQLYDSADWSKSLRYEVGAPGLIFAADQSRKLLTVSNSKARLFWAHDTDLVATFAHPNFTFSHYALARMAPVAVAGSKSTSAGIQIWHLPMP